VAGPVDGGGRDAQPQIDLVFGILVGIVHENAVQAALAGEVVLGQRGPFIRRVRFVADERELAAEAIGAQRFRGLGAGQAATDNHNLSVATA
jgi:hypothetical protein